MSKAFTKTISFSLDTDSIQDAIRQLRDVQKCLDEAVRGLIEVLMADGVDHAKAEVIRLEALESGGLEASIGHSEYDPATKSGVIYAGAYYAIFVEFGTGIVGKGSPHPDPSGVGIGSDNFYGSMYTGYDTNNHGEKGWVYQSDFDGKWHWTKGMRSRPFMYNTMVYLRDVAEEKGGEVIARYIW